MRGLLKTINYRGYEIKIYPDEVMDTPNDWDDEVLLVYDHRQFCIPVDGFNPEDIFEHIQEGYKTYDGYWVFPVFAYIHGGVSLSLSRDRYPFTDRWDVSFKGFMLVKRKNYWSEEKAFEVAKSELETWNQILRGEVYWFIVEDDGELIDSCGGFIGDDDCLIDEAKSGIDQYIENKIKEHGKQVKSWIINRVPEIYRTQPAL